MKPYFKTHLGKLFCGATLVVAEKLGRRWVGIELNPEYCELIKHRFENELDDVVKFARLDVWLNK